MTNMKEQNTERSLVQDCQEKTPILTVIILILFPICVVTQANARTPLKNVFLFGPIFSWLEEQSLKKSGVGQHQLCDPQQTGQIINDLDTPDRNVIYRYTKAMRGADEAMLDMFRNMVVIDEQAKAHPVPIVWGSQEKAVAVILQDNVRKDNSLVVDRIRLPILAIHQAGLEIDKNRFIYQKGINYLRNLRPDNQTGLDNQRKVRKRYNFRLLLGFASKHQLHTLRMDSLLGRHEPDCRTVHPEIFTCCIHTGTRSLLGEHC